MLIVILASVCGITATDLLPLMQDKAISRQVIQLLHSITENANPLWYCMKQPAPHITISNLNQTFREREGSNIIISSLVK